WVIIQQTDVSCFLIDEPGGVCGSIAPAIVGTIQVLQDANDIVFDGFSRDCFITGCCSVLQNLLAIAVEPDVESSRKPDSFNGQILGYEMTQVRQQAIVLRVARC